MHTEDSGKWYQRIWPFKRKSKPEQETRKKEMNRCVRLVIRPLRIFQFLVVLLILVLIVYTIMLTDSKLSSAMYILLIVFSGVYVFVLAVDVISQFSGGELHTVVMFLFSFLGTIFFAIIGALLLFYYTAVWYILTIACLSILAFILFLIDVSLILAFWKRTCNLCHQCCYSKQTEVLFQKHYPVCGETVKYDLMTSISNVKVPSDDENAIPDHSCRRVGYGRRRQYVDCPTSARKLAFVDVVDVQTEQRLTTDIQSQTQQQVKEAPVQTVSRCELCNRKIQLYSSPSAMMQATTQQPQCSPCPALVQLTRGTPCCPGCRCVTGIIQVLQQSQQQQTQRLDQSKQDKESIKEQKHWVQAVEEASYDTLTSNQRQSNDSELTGIGGTITKLTLASYCVTPKRTHKSSQTTASDVGKAIKKSTELEEPKKVRINAVKKEKERDKVETKKKNDVLPTEKERTKVTNNAMKKVGITKAPAKKVPEPEVSEVSTEPAKTEELEHPVKEPVKHSSAETDTVKEDATVHSIDSIHKTLGKIKPSKLISPPRQMADIIDRLQEIEGTKMEKAKEKAEENGEHEEEKESLNEVTKENTNSISICIQKEADSNKVQTAQKKKMDDKECGNKCTASEGTVSKTEASQETESTAKPRVETQTADPEETTSGSRTKKIYGFRKKNKVEPITHTSIDAQTSDCYEIPASPGKTEAEELPSDDHDTSDGKPGNICPACKLLQVSMAPNSNQYYCVHKDKRGRVFCEHCAPPNTVKVLYKNVDQKRWIKCAACGNSLRMKTQLSSRNKSDNCPNCGQIQIRTQAPVSA